MGYARICTAGSPSKVHSLATLTTHPTESHAPGFAKCTLTSCDLCITCCTHALCTVDLLAFIGHEAILHTSSLLPARRSDAPGRHMRNELRETSLRALTPEARELAAEVTLARRSLDVRGQSRRRARA